MRSYLQFTVKSPRTPMLLRALLVTAVGTLEPLMTRLVRLLLFHQAPDAFGSLADPRLDDQARRLCFGSPAIWHEVLTGRLGITAFDRLIDWTALGKKWEDRNILVHRAGIVDSRHSGRTGSPPNTVLEVEAVDVQSAIDEIGAARFGLVGGVWGHMTPRMGAVVGDAAGSAATESLRAGRWRKTASPAMSAAPRAPPRSPTPSSRRCTQARSPPDRHRNAGRRGPAQPFVLDGNARRWEPKRLRLRLFSVSGRLASSGRRLRLRLAGRWPWTAQITAAAARLQALPPG